MVLEKCDGICGDVDGKEEMVEADTSQRELWAGLCKHHRSVTGVSYHHLKAVTPCSVPKCFMRHCSNHLNFPHQILGLLWLKCLCAIPAALRCGCTWHRV